MVACAVVAVIATTNAAANEALERGVRWLLSQQSDDSGWHSTTYGQMRCGIGNTALALDALSRVPPDLRDQCRSSLERGVEFLLANLDQDGCISGVNHSADYPTYATAILLDVMHRVWPTRWQAEQRRMRDYLLSIQRRSPRSGKLLGGWPQIGGSREDAFAESNVNISVSRFVACALSSGWDEELQARDAARVFVDHCRNTDDGGYFFLPLVDDSLNKAGYSANRQARSYGTATADAVLMLAACGLDEEDPRLRGGIEWLAAQPSIEVVPGLGAGTSGAANVSDALTHYYWAALADIISQFPHSKIAARRWELRMVVVRRQRADGSWANNNALLHEDDPLIATALAVSSIVALDEASSR